MYSLSQTAILQCVLLLMLSVLACITDVTPGNLDRDANQLEAHHGMLAQQRRLARVAIIEAHRTPRTAIFNTIMETGQALRQLPASNVPTHLRISDLTRTVHSFLDGEVKKLEEEQMIEIGKALIEIDTKTQSAINLFIPMSEKSLNIFQSGLTGAILPEASRAELDRFESERAAKFDQIIAALKSLPESEAVNLYTSHAQQQIDSLITEDSPKMYNPGWSNRYSQAIQDEQEERKPIYEILTRDLLKINREVLNAINERIQSEGNFWQVQVASYHSLVDTHIESYPVDLIEPEIIGDVIRDTEMYDQDDSLPTLMQEIIDLLDSVLNYLRFLHPFLRRNNFLALLLLSVALLLIAAALLCPPVLFVRCKWQQFVLQRQLYEQHRARAGKQCSYLL